MTGLPSPKDLKKLADACRKAGITSFKGGGIEFTLSDDLTSKPAQRAAAAKASVEQGEIETDELSPDQLLFYSVGGGAPFNETAEDDKKGTDA